MEQKQGSRSRVILLLGTVRRWPRAAASIRGGGVACHHQQSRMSVSFRRDCRRVIPLTQRGTMWAQDFLWAGSSAFLLLAARLTPGFWYLSVFALFPFLARTYRATASQAMRLGLMFGLAFYAISGADGALVEPLSALARIGAAAVLVSVVAWAAAWSREQWGFNPIIVALLWVALEIGLIRFGIGGSLVTQQVLSIQFFHGLATLFGFLILSFLVVLINSVIIAFVDKALALARARGHGVIKSERQWNLHAIAGLLAQDSYLVPESRGPPRPSIVPQV